MEAKTPFKEPRTKWKNSKAKIKLYDDLVDGNIPLEFEGEEESEDDILFYYMSRDEYQLYDPDMFKSRLDSLRHTVNERQTRARDDLLAYQKFKENHQAEVSLVTKRGYIQWQNSIAQVLLKQDIDLGIVDK